MTESDWLTSTDLQAMLCFLRDSNKLSERKARLFAVSCCRRIGGLLTSECRHLVNLLERVADSKADAEGLGQAVSPVWKQYEEARLMGGHLGAGVAAPYAAILAQADDLAFINDSAKYAAVAVAAEGQSYQVANHIMSMKAERVVQAVILRDIVGPLPFRPLPPLERPVRAWNDGLIQRLAEEAYQQRQLPSGHLDPDRLAVLADALEEAGADTEMVEHLRGPGPHCRGCFVVDFLTGRE